LKSGKKKSPVSLYNKGERIMFFKNVKLSLWNAAELNVHINNNAEG
jgi:hypothetical protein